MLSKFNNESRFNLLSFPINNFRAASSVSLDSEKSAVVSFTINISFESASIEAQGRLTPEPGGGSWRGFSWLHRNKIDRTRRPGINLVDSACLRSRENLQMHGAFSFFFFFSFPFVRITTKKEPLAPIIRAHDQPRRGWNSRPCERVCLLCCEAEGGRCSLYSLTPRYNGSRMRDENNGGRL